MMRRCRGETDVLCARLGLAGLQGLGGRAATDAQVRPAVEGHDRACHHEEDDGADDQ
jgi:hypothetical protein